MRRLAFLLALVPAPVMAETDPFAVTALEQCLDEATETGRARLYRYSCRELHGRAGRSNDGGYDVLRR